MAAKKFTLKQKTAKIEKANFFLDEIEQKFKQI